MLNIFFIPTVFASGVITDAPSMTDILLNVLSFLLSIIGIVGILTLVMSGVMYFISSGNEGRIRLAKKMTFASIIGIVVALGALVVVRQMIVFFS